MLLHRINCVREDSLARACTNEYILINRVHTSSSNQARYLEITYYQMHVLITGLLSFCKRRRREMPMVPGSLPIP
jgi:hypothetical protein